MASVLHTDSATSSIILKIFIVALSVTVEMLSALLLICNS